MEVLGKQLHQCKSRSQRRGFPVCYCDKNNTELNIGDAIEKDSVKFIIVAIKSYTCATVAIVENVKTKQVDTFHLRDIVKI
jgi:hypothetical protein